MLFLSVQTGSPWWGNLFGTQCVEVLDGLEEVLMFRLTVLSDMSRAAGMNCSGAGAAVCRLRDDET